MNISIEYCHVYADDPNFEESSKQSIKMLREVLRDVEEDHAMLAVMIDDYSPKDTAGFPYDNFLSFLNQYEAVPGLLINESSLIESNLKLLKKLPDGKVKKNYHVYLSQKLTHPCSLFIATWYLARLGYIHKFDESNTVNVEGFQKADYLINILPKYFIDYENKAAQIIREFGLQYSTLINNIYV